MLRNSAKCRYYVDLSRNLWDTRSELLKKLSK